ncbi:MerR family transcriptional regulator [Portibacter marinus]|uniref:MerR family transcriptional regulator n=1 Tax=Portibacter marinus TaxID=2898660 RepID=UPI001F221ACD|nr:MerR family transcriptional regulator [Portibacter marinus]
MKIKLDPDKLYYSIGEVSEMFDVSNSLIRYWESEFSKLKPQKNSRGDRKYTERDINTLKAIYILVKEKGYTIDGAKKALKEELSEQKKRDQVISRLRKIRESLIKLQKSLEE